MPPVIASAAAAISSIFAASTPLNLLAFTSVSAAGATAATVSLSAIALNLVIGTALSAAGSLLARAGQRSLTAGVNSNEIRLNTRQEAPPVRWIFGEVLVGGALCFEECKPPFLYLMVLISEGPITSIITLYSSQTQIGVDTTAPFTVLTEPYNGNLFVNFRNGETDQAICSIIAADFTNLPATFRQRGIATLTIKADYGADFDEFQELWGQGGKPNILAKVRGLAIYDPRDPGQSRPPSRKAYATQALFETAWDAARETWQWSNNATLVQAFYLISRFGGRIDSARIDWDKIASSATYDDGLIGTNSGELIKRHTIDGVITAGQDPYSVLQSMLTANRGILVRSQGMMWIETGPKDPVLTITDDLIVGGIDYRRSQPRKSLINRVRCRFIDPRQDWQTVDGPIIDDSDYQEDDGQLLEANCEFPFTADHRRAQRLAKAHLMDSRLGREITTVVSLDAIARCKDGEIEPGKAVRIVSEILPLMNGIYRVMEVGFVADFSALEIALVEYDRSIEDDWNPETDEQDFELPDLDVS